DRDRDASRGGGKMATQGGSGHHRDRRGARRERREREGPRGGAEARDGAPRIARVERLGPSDTGEHRQLAGGDREREGREYRAVRRPAAIAQNREESDGEEGRR